MKRTKRGISLIVLIITIIIMIVLAGTIILSLTSNDIIGNSRVALFKNNAASYKTDLNMSLSDKMLSDSTFSKYLVNAYTLSDIKEYIPSMKAGDEEKFAIQTGDLVYIGEDTNEILQMREIGIDEGFIIGRTYSTVYLNPNISIKPDDMGGLTEIILNEGDSDTEVRNIITYNENANNVVVIKKFSGMEYSQPAEVILVFSGDNLLAIYSFSDFNYEEDGQILFTVYRGWNELLEENGGMPTLMADEDVEALEVDLGTISTSNGQTGHELLHYCFSTVPY